MNNMKISINKNLVFLRKVNGLTLEDVAEKINVSRQAASKWENGDSIPDVINCIALAELYNVSVDDLLYYDEKSSDAAIAPKGKHIFGTTILGERGQVVIPKQARDLLNLKSGDTLVVLGDENPGTKGIALVPSEMFMKAAEEIIDACYPKSEK